MTFSSNRDSINIGEVRSLFSSRKIFSALKIVSPARLRISA